MPPQVTQIPVGSVDRQNTMVVPQPIVKTPILRASTVIKPTSANATNTQDNASMATQVKEAEKSLENGPQPTPGI